MKQYISTPHGLIETSAGGTYVLRSDYEKLRQAVLELFRQLESEDGPDAAVKALKELL